MPEELINLLILIGISLAVALAFIVPIVLWRSIRKKPILPKGKKLNSPNVFYTGIVLFGSFAALSFFTDRPYFGSAILLLMVAFIWGLIAYKRGWRG